MPLNETGRVFLELQCTNQGVVCLFLEVSDHFMQGGHRHLRRTEQHYLLYFTFYIFLSVVGAKVLQPHESLNKSQIK